MKNINIIIGRFQPLTYGHLKCLKELYDETGMKIILCIIKVIDTNEKHPFKSAELIKIYKNIPELYKYIEDIIEVPNADIVKIEESLNKLLKIADMIDDISPIHPDKCPPVFLLLYALE